MKRRNWLILSATLLISGAYFAVKNHAPDSSGATMQPAPQDTSVLSKEPTTEMPTLPPSQQETKTEVTLPESAPPAPVGAPPLDNFKPPIPEIGASAPLPEDETDKSLWTINEERGLTHREIRKIIKTCREQFKSDHEALKKCAFDMGEEYKKAQPAPKETASPDVEVGPSW